MCLRGANGPPRRDSYHLYLGGQECGRNGCGVPLLVLLVTDCFWGALELGIRYANSYLFSKGIGINCDTDVRV